MNNYKLGSLFDGSGGFPLAGALCGIEPVWAAEVEPYPIAVTRSRFPKMKHLGDISKVNGAKIEPVDIITFGSPCQDLSVAGKRAGLKHTENGDEETTRSGLFMEAVRIIKEMRNATNGQYPTFALWENVPGAFSSNAGQDFRVVCEELIKIVEPTATMPEVPQKGWNYADSYVGDGWSLAYRVLDAQYWGVPQRRRRIYLAADFRGQRAREVLFEREGLRGYFTQGRTPWQATPSNAQGSSGADDREGEGNCVTPWDVQSRRMYTPDGKWPSLYGGEGGGHGYVVTEPNRGDGRGRQLDDVIAIDKESFCSGVGFDRKPGITVGGPCATLQAQGVPHAVCYEAKPQMFENHSQDTRYRGPLETAQTVSATYGMGGNNQPFVVVPAPFCKSARGKFKGDAETWKDATVTNTLNTFDTGETRANELVVETVALEGNGQRPSHKGDGYAVADKSYTLNATEIHGIAYRVDQSPPICVADHPTPKVDEKGVAFTLNARDYKNPAAIAYENPPVYIVRRLTPTECARLQGFADRHGHLEKKTFLTDAEYEFWTEVRNTHAAINGKKVQAYTRKQMLTWYNKLWTDSAEYKMWGNGIALPTALYAMQGIKDALNHTRYDGYNTEVAFCDESEIEDWML